LRRTAENLRAHELVGLRARIVESSDPTLVGREGLVVYETMKTIHMISGGRRIIIPKQNTVFEFMVDGTPVILAGSTILKRPEDRTSLSP
jgi:ribonuclease P protein subunit POP4